MVIIGGLSLTDKLTGSELIEKTFAYITIMARECRKALILRFEHERKATPTDSLEAVIRQEIESWFSKRDNNIKLSHMKTISGRQGEILSVYSGASKDIHFKIYVDSLFTFVNSAGKTSAYLKSLNVRIDKRDFTK
ncbi:MAG: hypothetical protein QG670_1031 [Thermoproteota archaeon]|nr:hypothetical protein [Thermoproteota archaeon]